MKPDIALVTGKTLVHLFITYAAIVFVILCRRCIVYADTGATCRHVPTMYIEMGNCSWLAEKWCPHPLQLLHGQLTHNISNYLMSLSPQLCFPRCTSIHQTIKASTVVKNDRRGCRVALSRLSIITVAVVKNYSHNFQFRPSQLYTMTVAAVEQACGAHQF